jgi:hypothetical protein
VDRNRIRRFIDCRQCPGIVVVPVKRCAWHGHAGEQTSTLAAQFAGAVRNSDAAAICKHVLIPPCRKWTLDFTVGTARFGAALSSIPCIRPAHSARD